MDIDFFRRRYDYDPLTGIISSKTHTHGRGRKVSTGMPLGHKRRNENRIILSCHHNGVQSQFKAHRIAWLLMTGAWPPGEIDHIDGDGTNNRWANLRLANRSQQTINKKMQSNNTSGFKGVSKHGSNWRAIIWKDRKPFCLGTYPTKEEASSAYWKASAILHGRYARKTSMADSVPRNDDARAIRDIA